MCRPIQADHVPAYLASGRRLSCCPRSVHEHGRKVLHEFAQPAVSETRMVSPLINHADLRTLLAIRR